MASRHFLLAIYAEEYPRTSRAIARHLGLQQLHPGIAGVAMFFSPVSQLVSQSVIFVQQCSRGSRVRATVQ